MSRHNKEEVSRKKKRFFSHLAVIARLNVLLACIIAVGMLLLLLWARTEFDSMDAVSYEGSYQYSQLI